MFVRKEHIEALASLKDGRVVRGNVVTELYAQGLIDRDKHITEAGEKLLSLRLGDVFIASDVIKIGELYEKSKYIPALWEEELERRGLQKEVLPKILDIYRISKPNLILTPQITSFIDEIPPAGEYDILIKAKDVYGEGIINLMQAMRLLYISPPYENGRTYALRVGARKLQGLLSLTGTIVLEERDMNALKREEPTEKLIDYGLQDKEGKTTEMGQVVREIYTEEEYVRPVYLLEDEIEALKRLEEGKEIDRGTYLMLQFRGMLDENGNPTPEGKRLASMGEITPEGARAVVYSYVGEFPHKEWLEAARRERLIDWWITSKGELMLEFSRKAISFPYLTKYDVAILLFLPRNEGRTVEELEKEVADKVGRFERAVGEAESKGFVRVLQNESVILTPFGERMKEVVEYANTTELLSKTFIVTPHSWKVIRAIGEHPEDINKLWKKAEENKRDYYEELTKYVSKETRIEEKEVEKILKLLRITGFLGSKSLTDAGRKLFNILS